MSLIAVVNGDAEVHKYCCTQKKKNTEPAYVIEEST